QRPLPSVLALHEQDLVVIEYHGRDAGQRQRVMPDLLAQHSDELRDCHPPNLTQGNHRNRRPSWPGLLTSIVQPAVTLAVYGVKHRHGAIGPALSGKFAPRNRPAIEPSQRPSARKKCSSQPASRPTAQLSG